MRALVTGGAGFIGSHLVDVLMRDKKFSKVVVIDNLSTGRYENIAHWESDEKFSFIKADLANIDEIIDAFKDIDVVFHFAAESDVRIGVKNPEKMWRDNVVVTFNVLEAMRINNVRFIVFSSSSTVYGDQVKLPTPEDALLQPISIYGASKLAGESLILGYANTFKMRGLILRYANIIGARLRHGVIYDFIMKLLKNPNELEILGDGTQRKSYLHVSDAISATMHLFERFLRSNSRFEIYNVGNEDWITVKEIADIVSKVLGVNPKYTFTGGVEGGRGWIGDVKLMLLDINKLKGTGWRPSLNSSEAVERAAREIYEEIRGSQNP